MSIFPWFPTFTALSNFYLRDKFPHLRGGDKLPPRGMADRYANMQDDGDAEAVDGMYPVLGLSALCTLCALIARSNSSSVT